MYVQYSTLYRKFETNFPRNVGDACCDALTLQMHYKKNSKQIFPEMKQRSSFPISTVHSGICERFIYSHDRSAYFAVLI